MLYMFFHFYKIIFQKFSYFTFKTSQRVFSCRILQLTSTKGFISGLKISFWCIVRGWSKKRGSLQIWCQILKILKWVTFVRAARNIKTEFEHLLLQIFFEWVVKWFSTGWPRHTGVPWDSVRGAASDHFNWSFRPG